MTQIAYNTIIIGEGTPVVMLHGYALDHKVMRYAMEPILENKPMKRIYIDLPGMGLTPHDGLIHNADELIESLVSEIKKLVGHEPFLLAGMSYGGYLARGVMQKLKSQVLGMFLFVPVVEPIGALRTRPDHEVLVEDKAYVQTLTTQELEALREGNVVINAYVALRQKQEIEAALALGDEKFLEDFQTNGYKASYDIDFLETPFDKPVTILVGKQDSVVGFEDQFKLSLMYPRCTYSAIDAAGHALHIEQADLFNAHVEAWVRHFA